MESKKQMTLEEKLQEFANYRKAIKKPIRKESFDAFMRKLIKLGNGNEETMIEILEQSIANGWQGIFELKNVNNKPKFMEKVTDKQSNLTELFNQIDQKYGISKD